MADHSCIDRPNAPCVACLHSERDNQSTDAVAVFRGFRNAIIAVTPFWVALLWWLSR